MRIAVLGIVLVLLLALPVSALEQSGTEAGNLTEGLEEEARELLPEYTPGEPLNLWEELKQMLLRTLDEGTLRLREGLSLCSLLLCILLLCSVADLRGEGERNGGIRLVGAVGLCTVMLGSFRGMIHMSAETVEAISNYSAFLTPVMASACAMGGGVSTASALYAGTVLFSQVLLRLISGLLIPCVYFFLAIATAEAALEHNILGELRELIGWVISKSLRILLYVFIAYMSVTGVISGTVDASAVKAAKATMSGMIPVVGNILSDASEALLASAAVLKSSAGIFGMLAVLAICLAPLLRVGTHYLLLKVTAAVAGSVGSKAHVQLLKHFSEAMGYLLAMCATGGLLLLISTVCFMRVTG